MREFHQHLPSLLKPGGIYSFFNGLCGDDFVAWTCRDILVYGEEIVFLYRSNIILLSSPAFVQLTITDTENFWQRTANY
ncbi:unnamed protein product [Camellia sinensis]